IHQRPFGFMQRMLGAADAGCAATGAGTKVGPLPPILNVSWCQLRPGSPPAPQYWGVPSVCSNGDPSSTVTPVARSVVWALRRGSAALGALFVGGADRAVADGAVEAGELAGR